MEQDFYKIDDRWLASYFEKDWIDFVLSQQPGALSFQFPKFDPQPIYCPYHEKFIAFIDSIIGNTQLQPKSVLEIGSSLGRTFYETCKRMPSIEKATLVEPSQKFAQAFEALFSGNQISMPTFVGNNGFMSQVKLDTEMIRTASASVSRRLINLPYEACSSEIIPHDLVLCSNVVDQCKNPRKLVELLKHNTKNTGILALSCTYQWNEKYLEANEEPINDVRSLFGLGWKLLGTTNLEYSLRKNERFRYSFHSELLVYQKIV